MPDPQGDTLPGLDEAERGETALSTSVGISVDTSPVSGRGPAPTQLRKDTVLQEERSAPSQAEGHPAAGLGAVGKAEPSQHYPPVSSHPRSRSQTHLQRVHHAIGQHGHLPGHRLDTLLKLGDVSQWAAHSPGTRRL